MSHTRDHIIINSIVDPWTEPETHPGVAEHFTAEQIARIQSFKDAPNEMTFGDKVFLWRMLGRLLFTAL